MSTYNLPATALDVLESELEPGEHLLWAGKPDPKWAARPYGMMLVVSIPVLALAFFWIIMSFGWGYHGPANDPYTFTSFPLFGVVCLGFGLLSLAAPLTAMWNARTTLYAITDQRILIIEQEATGRKIRTFGSSQIRELERTQRNDGSGDLILAREVVSGMPFVGAYGGRSGSPVPIGFWGIPNVRDVEQLIRKTFLDGSAATSSSQLR